MRGKRLCLATIVLAFSVCSTAWGGPYSVIDLGVLPAGSESTSLSISNTGYVAGITGTGTSGRGFRLRVSEAPMQDGHLLDPLPGDSNSNAYHVNNLGQAVGLSEYPPVSGFERAVRWQPGSSAPVYIGGDMSGAWGNNDRGEIVGYKNAAYGQAVYWTPGDAMEDLPRPAGGVQGAMATAINNADINGRGQVVGFHGYGSGLRQALKWESDADHHYQVQTLADLPGGIDSADAEDINDWGKVVGTGNAATGRRATLWDSFGPHDLGDLAGGADESLAMGINNLDQVVGHSYTAEGSRAFLWDSINGMRNLDDLLDPLDPNNLGWTLLYASEINNQGWITGYGQINGEYHGFFLTPEPGSLALLLLAGFALIRRWH